MNNAFKQAAQKVASDLREPTLSDFFVYLGKEAEDQGVEITHASVNTTPSSSASTGMESKNLQHGKGTDDHAELPKGGMETGQVHQTSAAPNVTGEAEGIPDLSLAKSASSKLRKDVALATLYETLYS